MAQAGNTVSVHYTGRFEDGTVFDTSRESAPLRFVLGAGEVIQGFEAAIGGMEVGQAVSVAIQPEEGYGAYEDELVIELSRSQLPSGMTPVIGMELQMGLEDGSQIPVVVIEVTPETVTIDANHPLAGEVLYFDIELVACE